VALHQTLHRPCAHRAFSFVLLHVHRAAKVMCVRKHEVVKVRAADSRCLTRTSEAARIELFQSIAIVKCFSTMLVYICLFAPANISDIVARFTVPVHIRSISVGRRANERRNDYGKLSKLFNLLVAKPAHVEAWGRSNEETLLLRT
jgi:hypothetical protein